MSTICIWCPNLTCSCSLCSFLQIAAARMISRVSLLSANVESGRGAWMTGRCVCMCVCACVCVCVCLCMCVCPHLYYCTMKLHKMGRLQKCVISSQRLPCSCEVKYSSVYPLFLSSTDKTVRKWLINIKCSRRLGCSFLEEQQHCRALSQLVAASCRWVAVRWLASSVVVLCVFIFRAK